MPPLRGWSLLDPSDHESVWVVVKTPVWAWGGWRRVWGASAAWDRPLDDPSSLSMTGDTVVRGGEAVELRSTGQPLRLGSGEAEAAVPPRVGGVQAVRGQSRPRA